MTTERARNFASDNNAGICPEAWEAMARANGAHAPAYGNDHYTTEACDLFRDLFETDCDVYFTFNGTAANSLALAQLASSYHGVVCHELAHIETDECGAPEFYSSGSKILTVEGDQGKVTPDSLEFVVRRRKDIHYPKPRVLSLTQSTEVGTVYRPDEIRELGAITHGLGLRIQMDGARFANAVAHLKCAPKDITWRAGVDVLCFGGTKNGLGIGEAVIFFDKKLAYEFDYRCKQAGQLCSKMRYLAAPWLGLLKNDVWLRNGQKANAAADRLARGLVGLGVPLLHPREANAVFAQFNDRLITGLYARGWMFYDFIGAGGCRLMCSWDTTFDDVDAFLADVRDLLGSKEDHTDAIEIMRH